MDHVHVPVLLLNVNAKSAELFIVSYLCGCNNSDKFAVCRASSYFYSTLYVTERCVLLCISLPLNANFGSEQLWGRKPQKKAPYCCNNFVLR